MPSSSISLDAFERLPSLSFSRWMRNTFRDSVGQHARHDEAAESAAAAWASTRNASLIGALQNHL